MNNATSQDYHCAWEINVTADDPEEAARIAEALMTTREQSAWTVSDAQGNQHIVETLADSEDPEEASDKGLLEINVAVLRKYD